jgi:hypothetical protein
LCQPINGASRPFGAFPQKKNFFNRKGIDEAIRENKEIKIFLGFCFLETRRKQSSNKTKKWFSHMQMRKKRLE